LLHSLDFAGCNLVAKPIEGTSAGGGSCRERDPGRDAGMGLNFLFEVGSK